MRRPVRSLVAAALLGAVVPGAAALGAVVPIVETHPTDDCSTNGTKPAIVIETKHASPGVVDPGAVGVWEKSCIVENAAVANGSPSRIPLALRIVEPGDLLRVRDTRTYSKADKALTVTYKGTGLIFNKTLTGKQSCGTTGTCTGWATPWADAVLSPEARGHFVVTTTNQKGDVEKVCWPTFGGTCPAKL